MISGSRALIFTGKRLRRNEHKSRERVRLKFDLELIGFRQLGKERSPLLRRRGLLLQALKYLRVKPDMPNLVGKRKPIA